MLKHYLTYFRDMSHLNMDNMLEASTRLYHFVEKIRPKKYTSFILTRLAPSNISIAMVNIAIVNKIVLPRYRSLIQNVTNINLEVALSHDTGLYSFFSNSLISNTIGGGK